MGDEKRDVLLIGPPKPVIVNGLTSAFNLIRFSDAKDHDKFFAETAPRVRGIAVSDTSERIDGKFMSRFPRLEIVSSFGVADHQNRLGGLACRHLTPDVLTEESPIPRWAAALHRASSAGRALPRWQMAGEGYP